MHTIKFPIVTGKEKEKILAKGFRAMAQFHNIMLREAKRRLWHLQHDPEYQRLKTEYGQAAEQKNNKRKKEIGKVNIMTLEDIEKATFISTLADTVESYLL